MTDPNKEEPRSGWFQWALRKLWILGRPTKRPTVSETEEKFKGGDLPSLGVPVALVHEKHGAQRTKTWSNKRPEASDSATRAQQKTAGKTAAKQAAQLVQKPTSGDTRQRPTVALSKGEPLFPAKQLPATITYPLSKTETKKIPDVFKLSAEIPVVQPNPRPNVFANTVNKRAQSLLVRDLQHAATAAVTKPKGKRSTNKQSSVPRPTVPAYVHPHRVLLNLSDSNKSIRLDADTQEEGQRTQQEPTSLNGTLKLPNITLTGFNKLSKPVQNRPIISLQSLRSPSSQPLTSIVDAANDSSNIFKTSQEAPKNSTTKTVRAIRINPSSSDSSRSPSPSNSTKKSHKKRSFVYNENPPMGTRTALSGAISKRAKQAPTPQLSSRINTPEKLLRLPPITQLPLSSPSLVLLPSILTIKEVNYSAPQLDSRPMILITPRARDRNPILSSIVSDSLQINCAQVTPDRSSAKFSPEMTSRLNDSSTNIKGRLLIDIMREKLAVSSSNTTSDHRS